MDEKCQGEDQFNSGVEPIAVIGLACKFPQDASSAEAFWKMLIERRSANTTIPKDRFNADAFYHPNSERLDSFNTKNAHFLKEDVAAFDAPFFSIPINEAISMDPQQRGLLETTYQALENAGLPMKEVIASRTSVFIGGFAREFDSLLGRDPSQLPKYTATGNALAMLSNKISWFYDLRGPSLTIDTACSSGLQAVHFACQNLKSGESDMALCGASSIILNPDTNFVPLSSLGFLSPDGKCFSFDHRANGYARGEGFGIVVLKRLSDALRDGNTIRAVIRATGSNQDGRTPGITQPSGSAQTALIRQTYLSAGLDMRKTRYFEAHGPGTPVGDPVEASAIADAFLDQRHKDSPMYVGSVKSNVGHLEAASGIAGLIKTVLVVERGMIPPNMWYEKANPKIPLEEWNITIPTEIIEWPSPGLRRASVNCFGFGGANAHVVLDDAYHFLKLRSLTGKHQTVTGRCNGTSEPESTERQAAEHINIPNGHMTPPATPNISDASIAKVADSSHPRVLVWSAADEGGIGRLTRVYNTFLSEKPRSASSSQYLDNLAYTLSEKRSTLAWKSFNVAGTVNELQQNLLTDRRKPVRSSKMPRIAFVFTGQGAQWAGMGKELCVFATFRQSLEQADAYVHGLGCEWSVYGEMLRDNSSIINRPDVSQTLCTILQVALVDLLRTWKIHPACVVGHSSGEIAAAYCAGGLSRESAWKVAYYRGLVAVNLQSKMSKPGAMMAVALTESGLIPYMAQLQLLHEEHGITIGCVNSPNNLTLTGPEAAMETMRLMLEKDGIFCRRLNVTVPYHSAWMETVSGEYERLIGSLEGGEGQKDAQDEPIMYSSLTGQRTTRSETAQGQYWIRNWCSPVKFSVAVSSLYADSHRIQDGSIMRPDNERIRHFVEIGPHSALRRAVEETLREENGVTIQYFSAVARAQSATLTCSGLLGSLFCAGYPVDLTEFNTAGKKPTELQILSDLPPYPFDHSRTYWSESRLSKGVRFRTHPRHELLGTKAADWNPLVAKWRNIIRAEDDTWINDHRINDTTIYPAAGMIVMALEAARQLASPSRQLKGIRLRNVFIKKPLLVAVAPEVTDVEVYMKVQQTLNKLPDRYDFKLCQISGNEWVELCAASVIIEYESGEEAQIQEDGLERLTNIKWFQDGNQRCQNTLSSRVMYDRLASSGMEFGPTFRILRNITYGDADASALINVREWTQKVADPRVQEHMIHPTCLDAMFHLAGVFLITGERPFEPAQVPTEIRSIWFSNELMSRSNGDDLRFHITSTFKGYRESDFSMMAARPSDDEPMVVVEGYRATTVAVMKHESSDAMKRLCYELRWKPDVAFTDKDAILAYCNEATQQYDVENIDDVEALCLFFMTEALNHELTTSKPYLRRYIEWMSQHMQHPDVVRRLSSPKTKLILDDKEYRERLLLEAENSFEGKVYVAVGRNLVDILNDKVDALQLLFEDSMADRIYKGIGMSLCNQRLSKYVDLMAHKNPNMNILEIGAGTGGTTRHILATIGNAGTEGSTARYNQYDFTDISSKFFEHASEEFKSQSERMSYKKLDISRDPTTQGFECGAYDLVVASNVLHATEDIEETLRNARELLKPGGKLILMELYHQHIARLGFIFGLLPGWWLGKEPSRKWGPSLSEEDWHTSLQHTRFSGTDLCLYDFEAQQYRACVVMVSEAVVAQQSEISLPDVTIVSDPSSTLQQTLSKRLIAQQASSQTWECMDILQPSTPTDFRGKACIFLVGLDRSSFYKMGDAEWSCIKNAAQNAQSIVWIAAGGPSAETPEAQLAVGFGRTASSENPDCPFTTILIEDETNASDIGEMIKTIALASLNTQTEHKESEYMLQGAVPHIGRVVETRHLNDLISKGRNRKETRICRLDEAPTPLSLTVASPGFLDSLVFTDDPSLKEELAPDEVEVEVRASGVNFKDVLIALGQIPSNTIGNECSGVITRLGSQVQHLRLGDRVACCTNGTYRTRLRCKANLAVKFPDDMSFDHAAALPVVYLTAFYSLYEIGRLAEGETVLIHAAAGGVGQAAIQLAKLRQAVIFATVGTEEKKRLLIEEYGIPEAHIFSSRTLAFVQGIKRVTNGRGVDVILNALAGEFLQESWNCIAPLGRFVEIGKQDIGRNECLPMLPFHKNVTFSSVDLSFLVRSASSHMNNMMKRIMELAASETSPIVPPKPLQVYQISELETGFRNIQARMAPGKTVVRFNAEDRVPVIPSLEPQYNFDPDATYVISGGFGGLGRSIARWMVKKQARHLVILSRSGPAGQYAKDLIDELEKQDVQVLAPVCDVADEQALVSVIAECKARMPPIKGCIQGAMVLKDAIIDNMTTADFDTALGPKVRGSWNLHANLPSDMDFFVLLSGTAGITGNPGQSNYAAGNTYQDALARHRVARGQKGVSIALGMVLDVGFVAERARLQQSLTAAGHLGTEEHELHTLLDYFCDPSLELPADPLHSLFVTGLTPPRTAARLGAPDMSWRTKPLFNHLQQMDRFEADEDASGIQSAGRFDVTALLAKADPDAVVQIIVQGLVKKLSKALFMSEEDIDTDRPVSEYGVDSLVAVELRYWILKEIGAELSVFELLRFESIEALAVFVAGKRRT